jgi:MFS family permease
VIGTIAGAPARTVGGSVFAASYVTSVGMLIPNLQPLVFGAIADRYGLDDRALGHLGAVFIGAMSLATLSAPLWVRRVSWPLFSLASIAFAVAALLAGMATSAVQPVFVLFAILGVALGLTSVPAFAGLGDAANPERAYAVSLVLQSVVAAGAAILFASFILPAFKAPGMFAGFAALVASGALACRWLRSSRSVPGPDEQQAATGAPLVSLAAVPPVVALIAAAVFIGGVFGYWYFVERVGVAHGVSRATIGLALSLGSLANMLSSALAAWLGGRAPSRYLVLAGALMLLGAFAALQADGVAAYLVSNLLFSGGFGLAQPAFWAVIRQIDATNRLFVASVGANGLAGVAAGLLGGPVIERVGYAGMNLVSGALVVAGTLLLGLAACLAGSLARRPAAALVAEDRAGGSEFEKADLR